MGKKTNALTYMVQKPSRKRPLGIPTCRWEDNIKTNIEAEDRAWPGFIWLRIRTVAGSCKQGNEPSGTIQCGKFLDNLRPR
jgi:hypothetical protein